MKELSIRELSDLLVDKLNEIEDIIENENLEVEASLSDSETISVFPCRLVNTPIERIDFAENNIPIIKSFRVDIEIWDLKKRRLMDLVNNTDNKLYSLNFTKTNSTPIMHDEISNKYKMTNTYEVIYNALDHSFKLIK